MDYDKESEVNVVETFKPTVGENKITILSEPEETTYTDNDTGQVSEQIKMLVEIEGKQLMWYVGKGQTYKSQYKQLMLVGKANGKLVGVTVTLKLEEIFNPLTEKTTKKHIILEAVDLIPKEDEGVEETVEEPTE